MSHSWLIGPFWIHFRDQNRHLTHPSDPKMHFHILGPQRARMLVQSTFFLIFLDSWNPFTSFQSTWLQFLFWSFWSHLSSAESRLSSVFHYLFLYIIFLVCHLSTSLPRGQDDYIIESKFQLNLNLMSSLLKASYYLGHLTPFYLESMSSFDQLIASYNISG